MMEAQAAMKAIPMDAPALRCIKEELERGVGLLAE